MSLFAWTSSCSLAYIYGQDESRHEEYLYINGREYPCRIIASDGRSLEIKQALAGCLARALPGLVTYLRLPVPLSTLEKEMVLTSLFENFVRNIWAFSSLRLVHAKNFSKRGLLRHSLLRWLSHVNEDFLFFMFLFFFFFCF